MSNPPKIDNAPGLTWKPRKNGWEARWQARTDLVAKGYKVKSLGVWSGAEPTEIAIALIRDACNAQQNDMLAWGRGGAELAPEFDGTLASLIRSYQMDQDSPFKKLRYYTRKQYAKMCAAIEKIEWTDEAGSLRRGGETTIAEIKPRLVLRWHREWSDQNKVAMAHAVVGMLRILMGFGSTILEDDACAKLSGQLSDMRFPMPKSRVANLTAEQATEVRKVARAAGDGAIALAQAFQFELMLRQKDVIGEWVPIDEPGISAVTNRGNKWLRGIRWEEIDANMVITHMTSKRQKEITVDLRNAPMVVEELGSLNRADFPATGPIIRTDKGIPFDANEFRVRWRRHADAAGIPKTVRNMDSRAGAITEATDAGVPLEHVRVSATHSDIGMTQKYSRGDQEKTAGVMRDRVAHRNKTSSKVG